jgi:hypothetical protein
MYVSNDKLFPPKLHNKMDIAMKFYDLPDTRTLDNVLCSVEKTPPDFCGRGANMNLKHLIIFLFTLLIFYICSKIVARGSLSSSILRDCRFYSATDEFVIYMCLEFTPGIIILAM